MYSKDIWSSKLEWRFIPGCIFS